MFFVAGCVGCRLSLMPVGASVAVPELVVHALRFGIFRKLVFPAQLGYRVSLPRYVLSALPVRLAGGW